jgi:Mce-associated membrane protein
MGMTVVQPEATAEPVEPAAPSPPTGRLLRAGLGLLVLALAAATAVFWAGGRSADAAAGTRADVLAAARQEAVNLTSQDYRTVDADLRRMADGATGQLRDDLEQRAGQAKQVVVKNKAVTRGVVVEAGLVAMHGDEATALVAVDSVISSGSTGSASRRYRFQLDLTRVGGRWLVSNLTAVGLTS